MTHHGKRLGSVSDLPPLADDQRLMTADMRESLMALCADTPEERFAMPRTVVPARCKAVLLKEHQLPPPPLPAPAPSERLRSDTMCRKLMFLSRSTSSMPTIIASSRFSVENMNIEEEHSLTSSAESVLRHPNEPSASMSHSGFSSDIRMSRSVPILPTAASIKSFESSLASRRGRSVMLSGGSPLHPETAWKLQLLQRQQTSNHHLIHKLPVSPENKRWLESRERRSKSTSEQANRVADAPKASLVVQRREAAQTAELSDAGLRKAVSMGKERQQPIDPQTPASALLPAKAPRNERKSPVRFQGSVDGPLHGGQISEDSHSTRAFKPHGRMVNNVKAGERVISHQAKEQTKASIQSQVAAAPKQVKIKMSKPASTKTAVGVQDRCRTKDGRDLNESSSASDVVKRVGTPALQPNPAALPPIAAAAPRLVTATPPTAVAVPPIAGATMPARAATPQMLAAADAPRLATAVPFTAAGPPSLGTAPSLMAANPSLASTAQPLVTEQENASASISSPAHTLANATGLQAASNQEEPNSTEMVASVNFLAAAPGSVLEEMKTRHAQKAKAELEQRKAEQALINKKVAQSQERANAKEEAIENEKRRQKELEAQKINSMIASSKRSSTPA